MIMAKRNMSQGYKATSANALMMTMMKNTVHLAHQSVRKLLLRKTDRKISRNNRLVGNSCFLCVLSCALSSLLLYNSIPFRDTQHLRRSTKKICQDLDYYLNSS